MFKNYLKTAWRSQKKQRGYSFINIAGLALGMAASILIVFYILHERSYDRFHKDSDRIFRVCVDAMMNKNRLQYPTAAFPMGTTLAKDFPEVQSVARITIFGRTLVQYGDRKNYESLIYFADNGFFDVFSFPFLSGDSGTALSQPGSVVLTERAARKYFGSEEPVGKTLRFDNRRDYAVTGVLKDIPSTSHFVFDMLVSLETLRSQDAGMADDWINQNMATYIKLKEGARAADLESKFPALLKDRASFLLKLTGGTIRYYLQPLLDIHLRSHQAVEFGSNGDITTVYILLAIAVLILAIAAINFVNLATARAGKRGREVGMRKVVGADRRSLVGQFLSESVSTCLLALILALVLVRLALPLFESVSGIEVTLGKADLAWLIPSFIGLAVFVGLAAGVYPALFLSGMQPSRVLRGTLLSGQSGVRFRRILVVIQFVISVILIVGTAVIRDQLTFLRTKNPGFNKEQVLVSEVGISKVRRAVDEANSRLKQIPGVLQVSASDNFPGGMHNTSYVFPEGGSDDQPVGAMVFAADAEFVPALGIELAAGRNFSRDFASDEKTAVLINETAARQFGWTDPIGKTVKLPPGPSFAVETRTIVGVFKDVHMYTLRAPIAPAVIVDRPGSLDYLMIKVHTTDMSGMVRQLAAAWRELEPDRPFDFFFLDQTFDIQFRGEERLVKIFGIFSGLAIAIACLGLFGLASFMAERRTKEMGIRRVLGARTVEVMGLMSLEFLKLVALAVIAAWPVAYILMRFWLRSFAYRTALRPATFLMAGLAALAGAFLTVIHHAYKTAGANPVDSLKYE
jgi:putative ABC transport system permease protein